MPKRRSSVPSPHVDTDGALKVWAFKGKNCDLPSFVEGLFIHCRAENGSLTLYVDIPCLFSQRSIKKAAPIIQAWSERLRQWQKKRLGTGRSVGETRFYMELKQRKSLGSSYDTLAKELNAEIATNLKEWCRDDQIDKQLAQSRPGLTSLDQLEKRVQLSKEGRYSFLRGLSGAQSILRIMGIPDISSWCEEAIKNLQLQKPAFTKNNAPITRNHVRDRLRQWDNPDRSR
jgi:hypothetical protein